MIEKRNNDQEDTDRKRKSSYVGRIADKFYKKEKVREETQDTYEYFDPETGEFIDPDFESWAEENLIRDKGSRDGRKEFPPTNQTKLGPVETFILSYFKNIAIECRRECVQHLANLKSRINSINDVNTLNILKGKVREISEKFKGECKNLENRVEIELEPIYEDYRKQEAGLLNFKRKNKIGPRIADYSKNRMAWLFIGGIFLIECLVNTRILSEVSPGGFGEALSITLVVTAVNVFVGVLFVGEGWRSTNSISTLTQIRGYLQMAFFVLFLLAFNIFVGHGRDAMEEMKEQNALTGGGNLEALIESIKNAWTRLINDPFSFDSFNAPLLVVAGFLSFALASWKGYERDDPYPGYGNISRRTVLARREYVEQKEEMIEELKEIQETALKEIDVIGNSAISKRGDYDKLCEEGKVVIDGLKMHMKHLEDVLNEYIQAYQSANIKARKTKPPKYFGEWVTLDDELKEPPDFSPPKRPTVEGLAKVIEGVTGTVTKVVSNTISKFP